MEAREASLLQFIGSVFSSKFDVDSSRDQQGWKQSLGDAMEKFLSKARMCGGLAYFATLPE